MIKPVTSVIVPCYNQGDYLAETLHSVLAQTYYNWECIILDDGSTDNSKEVALSFCDKDERFQYIHQENQGLSAARNNGIKCCHGKYILPLDADDLIHKDYLAKAVEVLEQRDDVKIVYCRAKYFGDRNDEWVLPDYNYNGLLLSNQIFCSCVYRRSDYDKTAGYDTNMKKGLEDWDFLLSFLSKESKVYKIPEILFFYRKHGKSMISETNNQSEEIANYVYQKHQGKYIEAFGSPYMAYYKSNLYKTELDKILASNTYKVGNFIINPLRWMKNTTK